jgi:hypothetical protein
MMEDIIISRQSFKSEEDTMFLAGAIMAIAGS